MHPARESATIPDEQLSIEQRGDGSIVVRVRSEGADGRPLPDAVFSFRCGDPQYAYWRGRLEGLAGTPPDAPHADVTDPDGQTVNRRRGNSQSAR
jgi:hypothetical protein